MKKSLYDLTDTALKLMDMLYDDETDVQMILDTFESVEWEIEEKADSYAKLMKTLEADIAGLKAEEQRLAARRKALENKVERLKENLESSMKTIGKTDFKTALFSFKIQKNPPSAKLTVQDDVFIKWAINGHEEYLKIKEPEIDRAYIKKALEAGAEVFGAELVQTESLRIR